MRVFKWLISVLAVVLVGGCVVVPARPAYYPYYYHPAPVYVVPAPYPHYYYYGH